MFKRILVPTDGSELSQEAAVSAVAFAKEMGRTIVAFHAKPQFHVTHYTREGIRVGTLTTDRFEELTEGQAQEILGFIEHLCREAGVSCEKKTLASDNPYEAVIEAAKECNCDLIFMASHGRKGLSGFLLGSETQKVLTHSAIPVLVYRSQQQD